MTQRSTKAARAQRAALREALHGHLQDLTLAACPAWADAAAWPPPSDGYWFSARAAGKVIKFIRTLIRHTKGVWFGKPFRLISWQYHATAQLFGWLGPNGKRKFRVCWLEIPKKNGKSEFAAAIALYMLTADGEMSAEVYSAAADREQASLVYAEAAKMVALEPALRKRLLVRESTKRIVRHSTASVYKVLSSEVKSKHGPSPSAVIFDEIHAQPNRHLWDVLVEGTDAAREQQVIMALTTAGLREVNSIGWIMHNYAVKVRDGIIEDPRFLPIIYAATPPQEADAEPEDDEFQPPAERRLWWEDDDLWRRVNPALGAIFSMDKVREHYREVKQDPSRINNFLRFRLNVWVGQAQRYIPMDRWAACGALPVDQASLRGRPCWGGLDLSSTLDLTAFVLVFAPLDDGVVPVLWWAYRPDATLLEAARRDNAPYDQWRDAKKLTATPGDVLDYDFIRRDIQAARALYDIQEIGYDAWSATQFALQLQDQDGMTMVDVRQGYKTLSPPTKKILELVTANKLAHGGHPVATWCADNLAVTRDAADNVKPAKDKSTGRIDCIAALATAMSRWLVHQDKGCIYNERGLVVL